MPHKKLRLTTKKVGLHKKKDIFYDMGVIIAAFGNPVLLKWLHHMQHEIATRDYAKPGSYWHIRKMRYVLNTTGPYSMMRFIHLPDNKDSLNILTYLECNLQKDQR